MVISSTQSETMATRDFILLANCSLDLNLPNYLPVVSIDSLNSLSSMVPLLLRAKDVCRKLTKLHNSVASLLLASYYMY